MGYTPYVSSMGSVAPEIVETAERLYAHGLVLDTETTGKAVGERQIIEVTFVRPWDHSVVYTTLVNPGRPIPPEATEKNGITDEMVRGAPSWRRVSKDIYQVLKSVPYLGAYNATFDRQALDETATRYGQRAPSAEWLCIMRGYAKLIPPGKWRSLETACLESGIEFDGRAAHRAEYDAQRTARLVGYMSLL